MGDSDDEYVLKIDTQVFLASRFDRATRIGCMLCGWILEDFKKHGKLTDHPHWGNDKDDVFSIKAKLAHLELERRAKK